MLPVPSLEMMHFAWIEVKKAGLSLYGFLAFVGSDHFFPEYFRDEGLADLEGWTGGKCEIFVLQSPSAKWVDYARSSEHIWWKIFSLNLNSRRERGLPFPPFSLEYPTQKPSNLQISSQATPDTEPETLVSEFDTISDRLLLSIDGRPYSIAEVFSPLLNVFQHSAEIQKILYRFNLPPTHHPCLVFFKDLMDTRVWFVDLSDLLSLSPPKLRSELKEWFSGEDFREMIEDPQVA